MLLLLPVKFWYGIFIFIFFKIFSNFPVISSLKHWLRICCTISTSLWIFQFSFCYLKFHSTMIGKGTLISVLLSYWLFLWSNIWSIQKNVPCGLEKNIYSAVFEWSVLHRCVRSSWSIVLFVSSVSLLICVVALIIESGILSFQLLMCRYVFLFNSVHACFIYFGVLLFDAYMFIIVTFSSWIDHFINI